MNKKRNQIIGTLIGRSLAYGVKGVVYYKTIKVTGPKVLLLSKATTKYGGKLLKFTSKNYARKNFDSQKIFFDAIDASFFAD